MSQSPDSPNVIVFPPLLLGGAMVLGALLDWIHPLPLFPVGSSRIVGIALFVVGAGLGFSAQRVLRRVGTNISPNQPALALATDGPYRRTRNPLYVAGLIVYLGVACLVNGLAPFLLLVPLVVLLHWGVVLREERYLAGKFGDAYRAYRARVRRWV